MSRGFPADERTAGRLMGVEDQLAYWKRRARDAEHRVAFEEEAYERCRSWAIDGPFKEIRHLRLRCEFLYGQALKHGATADELAAQPEVTP